MEQEKWISITMKNNSFEVTCVTNTVKWIEFWRLLPPFPMADWPGWQYYPLSVFSSPPCPFVVEFCHSLTWLYNISVFIKWFVLTVENQNRIVSLLPSLPTSVCPRPHTRHSFKPVHLLSLSCLSSTLLSLAKVRTKWIWWAVILSWKVMLSSPRFKIHS